MKQSKLRQRRVIRFAILYFGLLIVFAAMIGGPVFLGGQPKLVDSITKPIESIGPIRSFGLFQSSVISNNNTNKTEATGTRMPGYSGVRATTASAASTGLAARSVVLI